MALFKIFKGSSTKLSEVKATEGYAYFTPDDGKFYIDRSGDGKEKAVLGTNRILINPGDPIYYIASTNTNNDDESSFSNEWTGNCANITSYTEGLTIIYAPNLTYKPPTGSDAISLKINDLEAKNCYTNDGKELTVSDLGSSVSQRLIFTYHDNKWILLNNSSKEVFQQVVPEESVNNWRSLILGEENSQTAEFTPNSTDGFVYSTKSLQVQPSTGTILASNYNLENKATIKYNNTTSSIDFIFN